MRVVAVGPAVMGTQVAVGGNLINSEEKAPLIWWLSEAWV